MKKLIMLFFAVSIVTANTFAQEGKKQPQPKKTPEERADHMTKNMTKALDLNAEQQEKIKALIIKREKERESMQANMKMKREQMEKQMDEDFQKVLNSEQFEKFKKRKEEMKRKRIEKRMPPDMHEEMPLPPTPAEEKK